MEKKKATKDDILNIFTHFDVKYGNLWRSQIRDAKEQYLSLWFTELDCFTTEIIYRVTKDCCSPFGEHQKYPPPLNDFLRACYKLLKIPTLEDARECYESTKYIRSEQRRKAMEELNTRNIVESNIAKLENREPRLVKLTTDQLSAIINSVEVDDWKDDYVKYLCEKYGENIKDFDRVYIDNLKPYIQEILN
jgi:hypothetical protein